MKANPLYRVIKHQERYLLNCVVFLCDQNKVLKIFLSFTHSHPVKFRKPSGPGLQLTRFTEPSSQRSATSFLSITYFFHQVTIF